MKQKSIRIILSIVFAPVILYEYFVFLWFWTGADIFNLISTPLIFVIYIMALILFKKKIKAKSSLSIFFKILLVIVLPILTMVTVRGLAFLFGINIVIW